MSGHLYAVQFSNGLVKVGMTGDVKRRIAQHAGRLAVAGITVSRTHSVEVGASAQVAEARLIDLCASVSPTAQAREWFTDLPDFDQVCDWMAVARDHASDCAYEISQGESTGVLAALAAYQHSASALAAAIGGGVKRQNVEHWVRVGHMPPPYSATVERLTGGKLPCECLSAPGLLWLRVADPEWPWHPQGRPTLDVARMVPA